MLPNQWMHHARAFFFLFFLRLAAAARHGADHGLAGGCKANEREALLQFKKGTVDHKGRMLSSWDEEKEEDCCRWKGVSCHDTTGHILNLTVPGTVFPYGYWSVDSDRYLDGNISTSLLELEFLEYLDLSHNRLTAAVFLRGVGSLKNLKHLNLSYNNMSSVCGEIPRWSLGNLSKLEVLDLSSSGYNSGSGGCSWGSCEWLSGLSSLRHLSLNGRNLSEATNLFETLNRLPSISYIDLSYCNLVQFDPTSSSDLNFTLLSHLDLSNNSLELKQPHWIANRTALEFLDLGGNRVEGVDSLGIWNHPNLKTLRLSGISISSNMEDFFLGCGNGLPDLVSLDLSGTDIGGNIPKSIGTCQRLEWLDLRSNSLSHTIPNEIGELRSLVYMDLSANSLNGSIPGSIGDLVSLSQLQLSWNRLGGHIPESLGQMQSLFLLDLSENHLDGVLTELHLSNLSKLEYLVLKGNSLRLKVPTQWVPPFSLSYLSVSHCKFGPGFPVWIRGQHRLRSIKMADSDISGALPQWIWDFSSSLGFLDLSDNMVTGPIPGRVPPHLMYLINLSSNRLEGSIPAKFASRLWVLNLANNSLSGQILLDDVSTLKKLDLSRNNFTGTIPLFLCNAPSLQALYLSDNRLTGQIPNCFCSGDPKLRQLLLDNNSLNGTLPPSFRSCSTMIILGLGGNRLSGEIPEWIGESMVKLRILGLASNTFHGSIPRNLPNLSELRILDFSRNRLSGSIPSSFGNFIAMKTTGPDLHDDEYVDLQNLDVSLGDPLGMPDEVDVLTVEMRLPMKGALLSYAKQLKHVRVIDLSWNLLHGPIPQELGNLAGLRNLNLSNNHLFGNIPSRLGKISSLESVDLSRNMLSSGIPRALEDLSFLSMFNVSYNNLNGTIPTKGQFSTFQNTSYIGNPGLCGPPLSKHCTPSSPQSPDSTTSNARNLHMFWFLLGLAPGFVFGFWILWGPLLLVTKWRYAYFCFLDDLCAKFYVTISPYFSSHHEYI